MSEPDLHPGWLKLNGSEGKPLWIWAASLRAVEEVADGSVIHVEGIESLVTPDRPESILDAVGLIVHGG